MSGPGDSQNGRALAFFPVKRPIGKGYAGQKRPTPNPSDPEIEMSTALAPPSNPFRMRRALALLALLAVLPAAASNGYGNDQSGRQHPFMESMQIMMDSMGLSRGGSAGPFDSPWSQFGQMSGANPMSAWGSGGSQMQQMMGKWPQMGGSDPFSQFGGQWMQAPQNMPFMGSQLDGLWRGRSGDALLIKGNQYRIQAGKNRSVQGRLLVKGNQLWLQNAQTKSVKQYEFANDSGRLVLRDEYGQLLLYRRFDGQSLPGGSQGGNY